MKVNVNWLKRNLPFVLPVINAAGLTDRSSVLIEFLQAKSVISEQKIKNSIRYDVTTSLGPPNFGLGPSELPRAGTPSSVTTVPAENNLTLLFPVERNSCVAVLEHKANRGFALLKVGIHPQDFETYKPSFTPEFSNFLIIQENELKSV